MDIAKEFVNYVITHPLEEEDDNGLKPCALNCPTESRSDQSLSCVLLDSHSDTSVAVDENKYRVQEMHSFNDAEPPPQTSPPLKAVEIISENNSQTKIQPPNQTQQSPHSSLSQQSDDIPLHPVDAPQTEADPVEVPDLSDADRHPHPKAENSTIKLLDHEPDQHVDQRVEVDCKISPYQETLVEQQTIVEKQIHHFAVHHKSDIQTAVEHQTAVENQPAADPETAVDHQPGVDQQSGVYSHFDREPEVDQQTAVDQRTTAGNQTPAEQQKAVEAMAVDQQPSDEQKKQVDKETPADVDKSPVRQGSGHLTTTSRTSFEDEMHSCRSLDEASLMTLEDQDSDYEVHDDGGSSSSNHRAPKKNVLNQFLHFTFSH